MATFSAIHSSTSLTALREAFELFDKDGDGTITATELQSVMNSLGQPVAAEQSLDMISMVDRDGNGLIDFDEFCEMMSSQQRLIICHDSAAAGNGLDEDELRCLFGVFDKDSSGSIDRSELRATMATVGLELYDADIADMMLAAGVSNADQIYYEDFVKMMTTKLSNNQPHTSQADKNRQKQEFKAVFATFDKDGDGFITMKEVCDVLTSMNMNADSGHIQKIFAQVDLDGNGQIDFNEFLLLVNNCEQPVSADQEIRDMFNAIDKDRSGFVDMSELKSTFVSLGVPLTDTDIRDMLTQANVKGDRIYYEDFEQIMLTHLYGFRSEKCEQKHDTAAAVHRDSVSSHHSLSTTRKQELYVQFAQFDKDGDGRISCNELFSVMTSLGLSIQLTQVQHMLQLADTDRNGTIDFAKFCSLMTQYDRSRHNSSLEQDKVNVQQVFKIFDKNNDGYIDEGELQLTMHELGMKLSAEDIIAMFTEAGCTNSCRITYQEFFNMMTSGAANIAGFASDISHSTSDINKPADTPVLKAVAPNLQRSNSVAQPTDTGSSTTEVNRARNLVRGQSLKVKRSQSPPDTWKAFKVFDRNSDGYVSKSELYHTLKELGVNLSLDELNKRMKEADCNQDGRIDYSEFCKLMRGAFESFARQAALLHKNKSLTETAMQQTVVDRSKHRQTVQACFNNIDTDHDGRINADELFALAKEAGIKIRSKQHAQALISKYGSNGDGTVNFNELRLIESHCTAGRERLMSQRSRDAEQQMRTAFKVFDIDCNGFIDRDELRSTLCQLGGQLSVSDAESMLHQADMNGDGQIDYEEFILMMFP
jgi:calmodulin